MQQSRQGSVDGACLEQEEGSSPVALGTSPKELRPYDGQSFPYFLCVRVQMAEMRPPLGRAVKLLAGLAFLRWKVLGANRIINVSA